VWEKGTVVVRAKRDKRWGRWGKLIGFPWEGGGGRRGATPGLYIYNMFFCDISLLR